jgi:hypothetical protein
MKDDYKHNCEMHKGKKRFRNMQIQRKRHAQKFLLETKLKVTVLPPQQVLPAQQ